MSFIYKEKNQNYLRPRLEELNSITNLIKENTSTIKENNEGNNKSIKIIPEFFTALKKFEKTEKKETLYKIQVEEVINILKNNCIKINLINIQQKYNEIFHHKYSLMTFSRILRNHLNLRFLNNKKSKIKKKFV